MYSIQSGVPDHSQIHTHTLKRNYAIFRQHTHTLSAEKQTISIVFFYSQQTRAHANRQTTAVGCDASLTNTGKDWAHRLLLSRILFVSRLQTLKLEASNVSYFEKTFFFNVWRRNLRFLFKQNLACEWGIKRVCVWNFNKLVFFLKFVEENNRWEKPEKTKLL